MSLTKYQNLKQINRNLFFIRFVQSTLLSDCWHFCLPR